MTISKKELAPLHALITISLESSDYQEKVDTVLGNYRKTANIPGFRKGQVPLGLIKKQYGQAVLVDEINKILQAEIGKYIEDEKLSLLGNPLPKEREDFDWKAETLQFDFEIGLAPEIAPALKTKKAITNYKITASDKSIDEQVVRLQEQYGSLHSKDTAEEPKIENTATIALKTIKSKASAKKFIGAKVGEVVKVKTKGLFEKDFELARVLGISNEEAEGLAIEIEFSISEINRREPAALDQAFFDKLFGEGTVDSAEVMKEKIKADSEVQFAQQADQKFMNDITEAIIAETKFDLPAEFLTRWIQFGGEKELTEDEAKAEYERSEKGIRYQLIEAELIKTHNLQVSFDELKDYAGSYIRSQMAQFGRMNPSDQEVDQITASIMQNQEEVRRLSTQVMNEKMLDLFKKEGKVKEKEISFEDFIKEAYA
jgi:trigger factor